VSYAIYLLSALVTALCSVQLLKAFRRVRQPLLLWSGLCFVMLTLSHAMVFLDLFVLPAVDLYPLRLVIACVALGCMLYGLVWGESE
jgi:hypothetical protein